ncbi:4Fe-4S dicluster domain-containing protein [Thermofilum sp.]|uniref:4Fe-4S dicluster domain-containing protein n=1 Tax=Thermofilum sp. TaxID=1961369 RepID=UPI00316652E8
MTEAKPSVSRRDFLKGLAAGIVAGAVVGGGGVAALVPPREVVVEKVVEKPTTVEKPVALVQPTGVKRPTIFLTEFFSDIPRPTIIWRRHELCAGDELCVWACSVAKEGRIWPEASRIRIYHFADQLEIIHLCAFCREWQDPTGAKTPPPCVAACPQGILKVSEKTGAIIVTDIEKCLGSKCGKCHEACPAKYPYFHPTTDKVLICDLCETRKDDPAKAGIPACVEACPNDALKIMASAAHSVKTFSQPPEVFAALIAKKWYGHLLKPEEVE